MELNFRQFIELSERNTVGTHNDYATGAFVSSSQSGTETGNDRRGLMPSTDMGIIPRDRRQGVIKSIKKRGGRSPNIDILVQTDNGHSKWLELTRGQYDNFQAGGTGNAPLAVGRRVTIDYQANSRDPNYDKEIAQIGKIVVH